MLYLIKLNGQNQTLLKIGYTKNLEQRIKTYKTHNPLIELVDTQQGNMVDENILHTLLEDYLFEECSEWFINDDVVYYIWNHYKHLTEQDSDFILNMKIFRVIFNTVKLINKKTVENIQAYLGDIPSFPKDVFYKYFIKDKLNISLKQYKNSLSKLIEKGFLIKIKEDLYILSPSAIKLSEGARFNIF